MRQEVYSKGNTLFSLKKELAKSVAYVQVIYLCLCKVELRGEFDAFRSRQVFLRSKPLFKTVKLLVTEHSSCFASSTAATTASVQFER